MMVGKNKTVRTDDHTRTEATEVHDAVLDGIVSLIQRTVWQFVVLLLHRLIDGIGQIIKGPHTLVGLGRKGESE
jgi:hypothetical protein